MKGWVRNKTKDHWWPVAIQKYWANKDNEINILRYDSNNSSKKYHNKKIGVNVGWHHIDFGGSPWTHSFEGLFQSVDNSITSVMDMILYYNHLSLRNENNICPFVPGWVAKNIIIEETLTNFTIEFEKEIVSIFMSLLVRSPAFKRRYAANPRLLGLPDDEKIGTAAINQYYSIFTSLIKNQKSLGFFVFLQAMEGEFIYGDGLLDAITSNLTGYRLDGYCIIPLTPNICLFFLQK